jgi:hypothetical protein
VPVAIERADAIVRVQQACAYDQPPAVDPETVEHAVDAAARPDRHGRPVQQHDDPDRVWLPTYDLNAACAAVWDAKAAQAASRFDLSIDGQTLDRSQLIAHCRTMAATFRSKRLGTLPR